MEKYKLNTDDGEGYAYPYIWALLNGAEDDRQDGSRGKETNVICPDEGKVHLHIEVIEE